MTATKEPDTAPRRAFGPAGTDDLGFVHRHIGPRPDDVRAMLEVLGYRTLDELIDAVVPPDIRDRRPLALPPARSEAQVLADLAALASENEVYRSHIGMGYADCVTPPVIQRNILENPGWYTAYTPYQAEIAQGRLEALLNFQTMVSDLTGLEIANASLLDEATAAAEAMALTWAVSDKETDYPTFLVDAGCHPQTIAVVETRAAARGIRIVVDEPAAFRFDDATIGALVQYPSTEGRIEDFRPLAKAAHGAGALVTAATDLLALALVTPPGEWGADIAVGNSQRFGVPLGYGGPHAAFFATREDYKRQLPGRIIGVSRDAAGRPALRMALQTREQHIRRDKATSNICTAQVLLAVIASMYAVYHGPEGIRRIAQRVNRLARVLARGLRDAGWTIAHDAFFDTVAVDGKPDRCQAVCDRAGDNRINLRRISPTRIGIALDETTTVQDVRDVLSIFEVETETGDLVDADAVPESIPAAHRRTSGYFTHPVFHRYRSETEMLRYIKRLEARDLSLTAAMIPLGSCTMKLNATAEMMPISWAGFARLHPFAPVEQARGYAKLFASLESQLAEITGLAGVSLQPNAGSQGEFSGLLTISAYHRSRGETNRTTCLIPQSAHGTNPASAVMAGMRVVPVKTDAAGNIDIADLRTKAQTHAETLGALMVTYPSTHGVFEAGIREICDIVHHHGGQVYMDGANLNALVGLCRPGHIGADVCHLNLHKTFCIPHGGGGPGMGPIAVAEHLLPFLPDHPVIPLGHAESSGTVSAAPWGSPSILPISWAYIALMGADGLTQATRVAILNANYIAKRLENRFPLLYSGANGLIAHECILDMRPFKRSAKVEVEDVAKRLIDFSFHPPTVSFPVPGTFMVEPTESEPKAELDRFCEAMIAIHEEIKDIEEGRAEPGNNILSHAPHTIADVIADEWTRPYSREQAGFPAPQTREHKVWPAVGRIDSAFGDRNLVCTCPPMDAYAEEA